LECIAQTPDMTEQNKVAATYVLGLLRNLDPEHPEPALQAASALIDIFSDENMPYDVNFREGGFLTVLRNVQGEFTRTVRRIDTRKPGGRDLRGRGEEVLANLKAFVGYRTGLDLP